MIALQSVAYSTACPADPSLPGLATALDPRQMQVAFQGLLFGQGNGNATPSYSVTSCMIDRVKYRAGEKCVISYRLQINEHATDTLHEQWFCVRVFPAGSAGSRYQKALAEPLTPPNFGEAVMWLPQWEMVLWAFPNDRKIGGLPALMESANRHNDALDRLVAAIWGAGTTMGQHTTRLIHYVPEHTCTVRVQLALANKNPQVPQNVTLFGKAYYDDEGAESYRLMQQLWDSDACRQGQLQIAQPLAYDPAGRILWQRGLPGRTLLTYELDNQSTEPLLAEAAHAVAMLHCAALPCRHTTTQADVLALLPRSQTVVSQRLPQLTTAVGTLVAALQALAPCPASEPAATLHGDLHLQNFFVNEAAPHGQRLALIDLDNLSTGSPWHDLGSFCAALYYRGLVDGIAQDSIAQSLDRFLLAYAEQAPWPLNRAAINWYTAAALLNERACRAITRMKEGRLELIAAFIQIATELLLGQG